MRKVVAIVLLCISYMASGQQEFNCRVQVIYTQVQNAPAQRFKNLEASVNEFVNNRRWSDDRVQSNEKIEWSLIINVSSFDVSTSNFKATAQILSSRPVYGTSYNSILLDQNDEQWYFTYIDFQPMDFTEGTFTNNLISLVSFYINIVLGLDADSFKLEGGTAYFNKAYNIMLNAQQRGEPGWATTDAGGSKNRYWLIENILNDRFKPLREAYYTYHIKGMDIMAKDMEGARLAITGALQQLQKVWKVMPNSMFIKVWFNAKVNEIVNIYCKALIADKNKVIAILKEADPANANKYDGILTCQ